MTGFCRMTAFAVAISAAALCACTPAAPTLSTAPAATPSGTVRRSTPAPPSVVPTPVKPSVPPLTARFVSAVNGISLSHPPGWVVQPATEPWTTDVPPLFREPFGDFIYDPSLTDQLFLGIASQPLASQSVHDWVEAVLADHDCGSTEPVTVDGASGVISGTCLIAAVSTEDRGYVIVLYRSGDDPRIAEKYDLARFQDILATVELEPDSALGRYEAGFRVPFWYVLPAGAEFDYGPTEETWFEIRVPAWAEDGHPGGIVLQAIGAGRKDACDSSSAELPLEPGPQAVIDYLKTIPQVELTHEAPTSVGDLSAVQAKLVARSTEDCPQLWPFFDQVEPALTDTPVRLIAVDVEGEQFAFVVFGEAENPLLADMADGFMDSVRFRMP